MADAFAALESIGSLAWQASWHGAVLAALVLVAMRVRVVQRILSPGWRSVLWLLVGVRLALPLAPPLPTSIHNFYGDFSASLISGAHRRADGFRVDGSCAERHRLRALRGA